MKSEKCRWKEIDKNRLRVPNDIFHTYKADCFEEPHYGFYWIVDLFKYCPYCGKEIEMDER